MLCALIAGRLCYVRLLPAAGVEESKGVAPPLWESDEAKEARRKADLARVRKERADAKRALLLLVGSGQTVVRTCYLTCLGVAAVAATQTPWTPASAVAVCREHRLATNQFAIGQAVNTLQHVGRHGWLLESECLVVELPVTGSRSPTRPLGLISCLAGTCG